MENNKDEKAVKKITKKEQAKIDKAKELRRTRRKAKARQDYLKTLGLEKEVFITLTTLRNIFTDKVISQHFPQPYCLSRNPNLSRSYQRDGLEMKLYRFADAIEAIKKGIPYRIKPELMEEHRQILIKIIAEKMDKDLPINEEKTKKINKI